MFQVRNLTITHKKDLTTLVERLSFVLAPGDGRHHRGRGQRKIHGAQAALRLIPGGALCGVDGGSHGQWTSKRLSGSGAEAGRAVGSVWEFCQSSPAFQEADPGALSRCARQVGLELDTFYDWRPMSTLSGGEACEAAPGPAAAG